MFNSIDEAIKFAQDKNDGGIPLFAHGAVEVPHSDPVKYKDVITVTIINKGDSKSIIERYKRPEDETRWPQYWKAFCDGSEVPLDGIPIKEFPMLTPADIATCQQYHIRTVEDLANYPDGQLKNIGSRGTSLKKYAREFLEYRKGPDIQAMKERIDQLEKQIGNNQGNMSKRVAGDGVSKPIDVSGQQQPRRKGRPPGSKNRSKKTG